MGSYPTVSPITLSKFKAGLLSVAVVVTPLFQERRPHLLFREATLSHLTVRFESREVPLASELDSDGSTHHQGLFFKGISTIPRRPRQDSNLRPFGPQPNALSTELRRQNSIINVMNLILQEKSVRANLTPVKQPCDSLSRHIACQA